MPISPEILQRIVNNDPTLTSPDLTYKQIGDAEAREIANALRNNKTLTRIDLLGNQIGDAGAGAIAEALLTNTTLTHVYLNQNKIKNLGAGAIANALQNNKTLIRIELFGNQIGNEGAESLAKALENNETLRGIGLNYNQIGDVGAAAIANALENNETLRGIDLRDNQIGNEGAESLAKALLINTTLTNIDLLDNKIDYSLMKEIGGYMCNRNLAIEDAVSDYSKSVLAPRLVRASVRDGGNEIILSSGVIHSLAQVTRKQLFENLTFDQILEFSKHWHQALQQTKSNGSKDFGKESWSLLFGEDKKEINVTLEGMEGWKLVTRNNSGELKTEGSDLNHCVGGYAGRCLKENSHIISVVNPEGNSVSTIEIETDYSNRSFRESQHMGKNNSSISQESRRAKDWLYNEIKEERISINYDALAASKLAREKEARAKRGGQAKMVIGFDPLDGDKVKKVRGTFKEMLPEGNEQLKKNFSSLVSLEEISIEGKKYNLSALEKRTKADLTEEEKDKESSVQRAVIVGKIQESLNVIFGENVLQADISLLPEGKKTKRNRFGQVVLKAENHLEENLLNKIEEIFNGKVSDDGYVIGNQTPKQVMETLKNHTLQIDDIKKLEPQESKTQLSSQEIGLATPAPALNNQTEITFGEEEFREEGFREEVQTRRAEQTQTAELAPRTSATTTDQEAVRLAGCLPQKSCIIS